MKKVFEKGGTLGKCKMCIHRYKRDGHMVIQLCPNGEEETLDQSRMPIGEEKRKEFVADASGKTFYTTYKKCGISSIDKDVYKKWNKKILKFYEHLNKVGVECK